MNDLDFVRALRADVPDPGASQLAAGRRRLVAAIAAEPRDGPAAAPLRVARRQSPRGRRLAGRPAVVCGALLAAIVVSGWIAWPHRAGEAARPPAVQVRLASEVLRRAAVVRGAHPSVAPSAQQWIYQDAIDQSIGSPIQRTENWERFDGRQTASFVDGRLVRYAEKVRDTASGTPLHAYLADPTPQTTYEALASLPSDPRALLAAIDVAIRGDGYDSGGLPLFDVVPTSTPGQREFQFIAQLLWQDAQSGVLSGGANVFRALATLPGVVAQTGLTDALGRPAVAISDDAGRFQLLLSPQTYQVLGIRSVSTGGAPHLPNGGTAPRGTVVQSFAITDRFVAAPGDR